MKTINLKNEENTMPEDSNKHSVLFIVTDRDVLGKQIDVTPILNDLATTAHALFGDFKKGEVDIRCKTNQGKVIQKNAHYISITFTSDKLPEFSIALIRFSMFFWSYFREGNMTVFIDNKPLLSSEELRAIN